MMISKKQAQLIQTESEMKQMRMKKGERKMEQRKNLQTLWGMFGMKRVLLMMLCVLALAVTTGCASKSADMKDYVSVEFSGYNSRGHADVLVDYGRLAEDLLGPQEKAKDQVEYAVNRDVLRNAVRFDVNNTESLSNGDTLQVSFSVEEAVLKKLHVSVKATDLTFTVEGLEEIDIVDAFQDVTVSFFGYSPKGMAQVKSNAKDIFLQSAKYEVYPKQNLSNGDTVVVTVQYSDILVEKYGCIPEYDSKEYVVTGLGQIIQEQEQIDEACMRYMADYSVSKIQEYMKGSGDNVAKALGDLPLFSKFEGSFGDVTPDCVYFLSKKEFKDSWLAFPDYRFAMISSVPAQLTAKGETLFDDDAYCLIIFNGLLKEPDGTVHPNGIERVILKKTKEECVDQIWSLNTKYVIWDELPVEFTAEP